MRSHHLVYATALSAGLVVRRHSSPEDPKTSSESENVPRNNFVNEAATIMVNILIVAPGRSPEDYTMNLQLRMPISGCKTLPLFFARLFHETRVATSTDSLLSEIRPTQDKCTRLRLRYSAGPLGHIRNTLTAVFDAQGYDANKEYRMGKCLGKPKESKSLTDVNDYVVVMKQEHVFMGKS